MEPITQSAVAGLIAALTATAILGIARYIRQRLAKRRDVKYIRGLLITGRERVMESKDTFHRGMDAWMTASALRAAQYNYMMKQVGVALERWTVHLSHDQRRDIYDALDWYSADGLYAVERNGKVQFKELPEGRWPTTEMPMEEAERKFEKLQSVKWLKLKTW